MIDAIDQIGTDFDTIEMIGRKLVDAGQVKLVIELAEYFEQSSRHEAAQALRKSIHEHPTKRLT